MTTFKEPTIAIVSDAASRGLTLSEASRETGLCPITLRKYARAFGITFVKIKDRRFDRAETIARLAAEGLHVSQVAEKIGLSYALVCKEARDAGIKFKPAPRGLPEKTQDDRADEMARRYRAGETLEQIGETYGITRERVRQLVKKYHGLTAKQSGRARTMERKKAERAAIRDAETWAKWGCTWAQYKYLRALGRELGKSWSRQPIGAFCCQRKNAEKRHIGWELTLWQWWTIWQESGHWHERGRGNGYVMARFGDAGPYAEGNVEIIPAAVNTSLGNKKNDLPIGVSKPKRYAGYVALRQVNGRKMRLGSFKTPEEAHAAYLAAGPT